MFPYTKLVVMKTNRLKLSQFKFFLSKIPPKLVKVCIKNDLISACSLRSMKL